MNTSLYLGPIAQDLGAAGMAGIVGLGLASTLCHGVAVPLHPRHARQLATATPAVTPEPVQ